MKLLEEWVPGLPGKLFLPCSCKCLLMVNSDCLLNFSKETVFFFQGSNRFSFFVSSWIFGLPVAGTKNWVLCDRLSYVWNNVPLVNTYLKAESCALTKVQWKKQHWNNTSAWWRNLETAHQKRPQKAMVSLLLLLSLTNFRFELKGIEVSSQTWNIFRCKSSIVSKLWSKTWRARFNQDPKPSQLQLLNLLSKLLD